MNRENIKTQNQKNISFMTDVRTEQDRRDYYGVIRRLCTGLVFISRSEKKKASKKQRW